MWEGFGRSNSSYLCESHRQFILVDVFRSLLINNQLLYNSVPITDRMKSAKSRRKVARPFLDIILPTNLFISGNISVPMFRPHPRQREWRIGWLGEGGL